jgi:hypothetical protein
MVCSIHICNSIQSDSYFQHGSSIQTISSDDSNQQHDVSIQSIIQSNSTCQNDTPIEIEGTVVYYTTVYIIQLYMYRITVIVLV